MNEVTLKSYIYLTHGMSLVMMESFVTFSLVSKKKQQKNMHIMLQLEKL